MSVRKQRNRLYSVHTSTGFSYWYVPSMYITKCICESTNQYVLPGVTTVFRGMMNSPSDQMLQDTFQRNTRAYLSVIFRKIRVDQWVNIFSLYIVCTEYIRSLYLTLLVRTCTKHTSTFPQARSALRHRRVSAARFFRLSTLASCLSADSSLRPSTYSVHHRAWSYSV
jgi:hypothetical protein